MYGTVSAVSGSDTEGVGRHGGGMSWVAGQSGSNVLSRAVAPVVADLVSQGVLIQFDAKPGAGRQIEVAATEHERLFHVALAERHLLLTEEVGDGRRQLHSYRQGDRPQRVVWGDSSVIGL